MSLAAAVRLRVGRALGRRAGLGPLVFLHIPKTGGTTVAQALSAHYRPERCLTDNGRISVSLLTRHADDIARGCFVHGHCEHATLPYMAGARLVTVLRRPEDHAISNYLYLRREPDQVLHEAAMTQEFAEFYRTNWKMMAFQAISLDVPQSSTSVTDHESFFSRVPAMLALLDRIDFVGCLDRVDALLTALTGGRRAPPALRLNAAPGSAAGGAEIDGMRAQYRALAQAPDTGPVLAVEQNIYEQARRRCSAHGNLGSDASSV